MRLSFVVGRMRAEPRPRRGRTIRTQVWRAERRLVRSRGRCCRRPRPGSPSRPRWRTRTEGWGTVCPTPPVRLRPACRPCPPRPPPETRRTRAPAPSDCRLQTWWEGRWRDRRCCLIHTWLRDHTSFTSLLCLVLQDDPLRHRLLPLLGETPAAVKSFLLQKNISFHKAILFFFFNAIQFSLKGIQLCTENHTVYCSSCQSTGKSNKHYLLQISHWLPDRLIISWRSGRGWSFRGLEHAVCFSHAKLKKTWLNRFVWASVKFSYVRIPCRKMHWHVLNVPKLIETIRILFPREAPTYRSSLNVNIYYRFHGVRQLKVLNYLSLFYF